jgi:fermentation-respiration switch protein FrsA (DUF1100 family)
MQTTTLIEREKIGAVPLLIARPGGVGTYPLILALHGYTGNKETMLPLIEPLAGAGFVVAAPDAKYHGERSDARWAQFAQENESLAISRAVFETAGDLPALIDALLAKPYTRPDAAGGIGVVGVSMGALTFYAAVPLEARLTVAVSIIGGGAWGDRFDEQFASLSPDVRAMLRERDALNHLDAFARLSFLLLAGELDPVLPAWATQTLYDALHPRIPDAERLRLVIEPGIDHTVTPTMGMEAIAWFGRWLR